MKNSMLRFFIFAVVTIIAAFILVRLFERHMVFFPSQYPSGIWNPKSFGLPVEDVWLQTSDDVKVHGWFVRHESAVGHLIMAHGNAGNLSDRLEWLTMLHQKVPANLLMFDYRGYGRSEGTPSEQGCYLDAVTVYDWLNENHPDLPIVAHGHSLGSAVVVELALRRELAGLIVESGFTNATDMARLMFGPVPVQWLSSMNWDSLEKIPKINSPKLFLHGNRDSVVPYHLGQELFEAAKEPKRFVELENVDHNDTYISGREIYYEAIREFIFLCAGKMPNEMKPQNSM